MSQPVLELHHIEKTFPGVRALHPLTLSVHPGEVVGLVGENGAGKSTLIRLVSGVHQPDGGTMQWQGQPVVFACPADAIAAGIATIHQELAYFAGLSVAENLLMGESCSTSPRAGWTWGQRRRFMRSWMAWPPPARRFC